MDIDLCIQQLKDEHKILDQQTLLELSFILKEILIQEPNIKKVKSPINICGDLHGQYYDLLKLFQTTGDPPQNSYIFIGDFVDRGYNSVETIQYLFCLKAKYPEKIILVRGNHESRGVSKVYGFYDEIIRKYGSINPWRVMTDVFDFLPIAALVNDKILCVHGGISPQIKTLDQIQMINRCTEPPIEGPYADLLWSDPDESTDTWTFNPRGAGWCFGWKTVAHFNSINDIELICRAHQLVQSGYKYWFKNQDLLSVWSAPNYCYRMNNKACVAQFGEDISERKFVIFDKAQFQGKRGDDYQFINNNNEYFM